MKTFSGSGNTFVIVPSGDPVKLCAQFDVEGLLTYEPSERADVRMRIFNRDGSEASMCGNGLRCLIHFLGKRVSVETAAGIFEGWCEEELVCVKMPRIFEFAPCPDGYLIDTGVPHLVRFVPPVNLEQEGRSLRLKYDANVDFVHKEGNTLFVRTYERGVEAETGACGTGALAAGQVASSLYAMDPKITIVPTSREKIFLELDSNCVLMKGSVEELTLIGQ